MDHKPHPNGCKTLSLNSSSVTLEWPTDLIVLAVDYHDGTWMVTFARSGDPARTPLDAIVVDESTARAIQALLLKVKK